MSVNRSGEQAPVGGSMADAMHRAGAAPAGGGGGQGNDGDRPSGGGSGAGGGGGEGRGNRRSIFGINNTFSRPIERSSTGEIVKKYLDAFQHDGEASFRNNESINFGDAFKFVVLDSASDQVALSAILVCYSQNLGGKNHLGVFTLIVEGSGQNTLRANRFIPINGKQVEIDISPGDTFNLTMWNRIEAKLHSLYGKNIVLHNAGASVLPWELNPEDTKHVHRVFYNVCNALYTIIDVELAQQQVPFSASMIDRDAQTTPTL